MDPMRSVASATVRKNLGPDPSMGRKVELLRRLVSMRQERGPKATGQPVKRPFPGGRPRGGGVPTRLPRWENMP